MDMPVDIQLFRTEDKWISGLFSLQGREYQLAVCHDGLCRYYDLPDTAKSVWLRISHVCLTEDAYYVAAATALVDDRGAVTGIFLRQPGTSETDRGYEFFEAGYRLGSLAHDFYLVFGSGMYVSLLYEE
jgi:hypothetical protein